MTWAKVGGTYTRQSLTATWTVKRDSARSWIGLRDGEAKVTAQTAKGAMDACDRVIEMAAELAGGLRGVSTQ